MDIETLKIFCSKDLRRPNRNSPYSRDGFTYATDGHILVRVKQLDSVTNDQGPDVANILPQDFVFCENSIFHKLEKITAEKNKCLTCEGTGVRKKCEDCEGKGVHYFYSKLNVEYEVNCKECDGEGFLFAEKGSGDSECSACDSSGLSYKNTKIQIGIDVFSDRLLEKLSHLDDVEISENKQPYKITFFKFKGGVGAIMPMYR